MPTVKFQNRDNSPQAVDPGEYIAEVEGFEFKQTPNTGYDLVNLKFREIKTGAVFYDSLFFTQRAEWRIDTFLRATGLAPAVGDELDFDEEFCKKKVVGARCWVSLCKVEMEKKPGKFKNEVMAYMTSKPAPPRAPTKPQEPKADW